MSASTIARWNAIPLERPEQTENLKRKFRDDDDDDDDISIASRTPSPPPDAMDVDTEDISKYDEYVRGPAREVITVETKIKPTNKGFAMLSKLGWTEGTPLGLSSDGRVDPIPFQMKSDSTGLGKVNQDFRMIESTVSQRRGLDSERQQKESDTQRQAREDEVARREVVANEISDVLKPFYCSLCDKQFQNVAQYDEHTNSYAHHHRARFKDMQASARMKPQEEIDKRKEKERKREEKELRKIAAANGIKMSKTTSVASSASSLTTPLDNSTSSGWATVSESGTSSTQSGFNKSGWATVGSSAPQPSPAADVPKPSGGWNAVTSPTPSDVASKPSTTDTPAFRTGGWSTLSTQSGSSQPDHAPPAFGKGGWTVSAPSTLDTQSSSSQSDLAPPPASGKAGWKTVSTPVSTSSPAVPSILSQDPTNPPPSHPPSKAHTSRVGWQQFQKSNSRRK